MNEKEIIEKLRLLKSIQPEQHVLSDIKKGVYRRVGVEYKVKNIFETNIRKFITDITQLLKAYRYISFGAMAILLLAIFSFMAFAFLPDQIHTIVRNTKVALASNRYEKASIALADIIDTYGKQRTAKKSNLNNFSQELAFTNTEMANLKLKGEQGKYTAKQCHDLYKQYLSYLKKEEKNQKTNTMSSQVQSQITRYEEQAEQKLHMYPHL